MIIDPETIYNALFNTIINSVNAPQANGSSSLTPLITMSRRWRKWDNLGDTPMPAFYQLQPPNTIAVSQIGKFGLSRYLFKAQLWFYFAVDTANEEAPTSPVLNDYFNAVSKALEPTIQSPGGARQQLGLGPKVENAWIDGTVIMDEGLIVPPMMLIVPVTVVTG